MSIEPDKKQLALALDWAFDNQDDDSLADCYIGVCTAIGSFDFLDGVFESKIIIEKTESSDADTQREGEDWADGISKKVEDLHDHLFLVRDELCLAICKLLNTK